MSLNIFLEFFHCLLVLFHQERKKGSVSQPQDSQRSLNTLGLIMSVIKINSFKVAPQNSSRDFPSLSHPGPPRLPAVVQHPLLFSTPAVLPLSVPPALHLVNRWPPGAVWEVDDSGFGPSGEDDERASFPDVFLTHPQTWSRWSLKLSQNTSLNHSSCPNHLFIIYLYLCSRSFSTTYARDIFSIA